MIKVGQRIRPIDEAEVYIVVSVENHSISAHDEHGFEYTFRLNEVVSVEEMPLSAVDFHPVATIKKEADKKASIKHQKNLKKKFVEYDLHAGVLLGNTAGLSNHQILTEQIEFAREMIEKAKRNNDQFVVFVHGKGKGRLRQELHRLLAGIENIEFYDADFSKYSLGATEVRLW